jgi:hypothetical protein
MRTLDFATVFSLLMFVAPVLLAGVVAALGG